MEESFPKEVPKVGGNIFASDLKTAYDTVRKTNRMRVGGSIAGQVGGSFMAMTGKYVPPTHLVEVIAEVTDGSDVAIPGVYTCAVRYYNPIGAAVNEGAWTTMVDGSGDPITWLLDGSDIGVTLNPRSGSVDGQIISAWWNPQRGAFIPTVRSSVRLAWATTTGEWNSSTLSWNVTTVEPFDGSTFDGDDPLSVANPQGLVAESGQVGIIAYTTDPTSGEGAWEVVYFKGLEQVVMTDFQVDAATFKLQKKTRTFFAQVDDAESGWTDIHTGTDCS